MIGEIELALGRAEDDGMGLAIKTARRYFSPSEIRQRNEREQMLALTRAADDGMGGAILSIGKVYRHPLEDFFDRDFNLDDLKNDNFPRQRATLQLPNLQKSV